MSVDKTADLSFDRLKSLYVQSDGSDREELLGKMSIMSKGPVHERIISYFKQIADAKDFKAVEVVFKRTQVAEVRLVAVRKLIVLAEDYSQKRSAYIKSKAFDLELQYEALELVLASIVNGIDVALSYFEDNTTDEFELLIFKHTTRIAKDAAHELSFEKVLEYMDFPKINLELVKVFDDRMYEILPDMVIKKASRVASDGRFSEQTRRRAYERVDELVDLMGDEEVLSFHKKYPKEEAIRRSLLRSMEDRLPESTVLVAYDIFAIAKHKSMDRLRLKSSQRVDYLLQGASISDVTAIYKKTGYNDFYRKKTTGLLEELVTFAKIDEARAVSYAATEKKLQNLALCRIMKLTGSEIKIRSL